MRTCNIFNFTDFFKSLFGLSNTDNNTVPFMIHQYQPTFCYGRKRKVKVMFMPKFSESQSIELSSDCDTSDCEKFLN